MGRRAWTMGWVLGSGLALGGACQDPGAAGGEDDDGLEVVQNELGTKPPPRGKSAGLFKAFVPPLVVEAIDANGARVTFEVPVEHVEVEYVEAEAPGEARRRAAPVSVQVPDAPARRQGAAVVDQGIDCPAPGLRRAPAPVVDVEVPPADEAPDGSLPRVTRTGTTFVEPTTDAAIVAKRVSIPPIEQEVPETAAALSFSERGANKHGAKRRIVTPRITIGLLDEGAPDLVRDVSVTVPPKSDDDARVVRVRAKTRATPR